MSRSSSHIAAAALVLVLLGAVARVSVTTAITTAAIAIAIVLAGSRRFAVVALCVLAALSLAGVRVDASHRQAAHHADQR